MANGERETHHVVLVKVRLLLGLWLLLLVLTGSGRVIVVPCVWIIEQLSTGMVDMGMWMMVMVWLLGGVKLCHLVKGIVARMWLLLLLLMVIQVMMMVMSHLLGMLLLLLLLLWMRESRVQMMRHVKGIPLA